MKKIALTSLLAAFAVSAANAETNYFVGGGMGFNTSKTHEYSSFNVAPEFGWKYSDNWDFGLALNFYHNHWSDSYIRDEYTYGGGVFARYKVVEFSGFKILLRGDVYAEFMKQESEEGGSDSGYLFGTSIMPMVTYDVTESFTLYAKLNFLGLYANYGKDYYDEKYWQVYGFGNADDLANTSDFQIGFNYNF